MSKFGFWFMNARPQALPQSVIPGIVAACMAFAANRQTMADAAAQDGGFTKYIIAAVALLGIVFAHLSVDLLDDYFDYRNAGIDARERLNRAGMRARLGKAPYLADGKASLKQTFGVAALLGGLALVCGGIVFAYRGWPIVWFVAAGAFLGFFYSAPPFKLCYHGLGELLTAIMFGPLLMAGMYYAICGRLAASIGWVSTAIGLLVGNILYTHSVMDRLPDISVGKTTLAVLVSPDSKPARKPLFAISCIFNFLPYAVIAAGVAFGHLNVWMLLAMTAFPMSLSLAREMYNFLYHPEEKAVRRWWMGPMSQWTAIEKAGLQWFMLRWYLARNSLSLVAIMIAIASFM